MPTSVTALTTSIYDTVLRTQAGLETYVRQRQPRCSACGCLQAGRRVWV